MSYEKLEGEVKCFSYRTKKAGNVFLVLPRHIVKDLEKALVEKAGTYSVENHTTYEVVQESGTTVFFFTDSIVLVGNKVIPFN